MSRRTRRVRLAAGVLVFLATWEVAARLEDAWIAGASPFLPYSINTLFRPSALGREGVPGARFGKWRMNGLGFRGDEPLPGRERVLVVGASETFGQYESEGHEYPRLLAGELEALLPGRYDVVNAALPGMRIGRMPYLEHALEVTTPRFIVVYPSPANYIGVTEPFCHGPTGPIPTGPGATDQVRLLGKLDVLVKRSLPPLVMDRLRAASLWWNSRRLEVAARVPEATLLAFTTDLDCVVDEAEARGAVPVLSTHATYFGPALRDEDRPLMIAWRRFYPELSEDGFLDLERRANAAVRDVARRRGALLFDAAVAIPPGPGSFADFVHFTDDGALAMARGLAGLITGRAAP